MKTETILNLVLKFQVKEKHAQAKGGEVGKRRRRKEKERIEHSQTQTQLLNVCIDQERHNKLTRFGIHMHHLSNKLQINKNIKDN